LLLAKKPCLLQKSKEREREGERERERERERDLYNYFASHLIPGVWSPAWSNNPTKSGYTDTDDIPNGWAIASELRI
jgi:hypothetical protein